MRPGDRRSPSWAARTPVVRRVRERRTGYAIDLLRQDLAYGLRMMVNKPGFSLLLVGTLALGLAASTALFSVVSAVLLDPLPYPEADQLVSIRPTARYGRRHFSPPDFVDRCPGTRRSCASWRG